MRKNNFWYLLVALLISIIVLPVAYDLDLISPQASRVLGFSSLLAIGVWSLRGAGRLFTVGMFIVIAGTLLNVLSVTREGHTLYIISQLALFSFLLLAAYNALRHVAVGSDINPNRIVGAICVYLLLGVMWSIAYSVLEVVHPGSFNGLTEFASPVWNPDWIYFSFVTITTLGYGDILPLTQAARALAFAEAIAGQFYLAVLVAGLVSAYITMQGHKSDQE